MHALPNSQDPPPPIEVGGCTYEAGDSTFAEAVARAYASRRRPRCLCRPGGVEMYVARLCDGYVVKRMPDTGSNHAPDCPSFEPPAELSGLAHSLGSAITEDPTTGEASLRLDFPLSKARKSAPPLQRAETDGGSATAGTRRLSLRGLLHYLWDQADLTQWKPSFAGKRSWAAVRQRLLRAAEQKVTGSGPLLARLYVPESFAVDQIDAINFRRRERWAAAEARPGGAQPLLLLIAEAKGIVPTHRGYKAVIKHVPDLGFAIEDSLYRAMGRTFGRELEVWCGAHDVLMVIGATFWLTAGGVPRISSLCLMPVTRQWLPVETILEQQLVERLVREQRAFRKLLRYDLGHSAKLASAVITDVGPPMPTVFADGTDIQTTRPGQDLARREPHAP